MVSIADPFDETQKAEILEGIKVADDAISGVKKAITAGIAEPESLQAFEAQRAALLKIKQVYWPNG